MKGRQFCPSGQHMRLKLARKHGLRCVANAQLNNINSETAEVRMYLIAIYAETSRVSQIQEVEYLQERIGRFKEQFSGPMQIDGLSSALAGLSTQAYYAVSAVAAAGAAFAGYKAASSSPLEGNLSFISLILINILWHSACICCLQVVTCGCQASRMVG
jgi:hypothetical protein